MRSTQLSTLGSFLRDRRSRLQPSQFGFNTLRRRTPGLRREEVAQLVDVSATWYTWLEQGRGGLPSAELLERLAQTLQLSGAEREQLFLLALGHPPEPLAVPELPCVTTALQNVLDGLECTPALIKTASWDVVAWNRAASLVMMDYGAVPADQRNLLRIFFGSPHARERNLNWDTHARFAVAVFRLETSRSGFSPAVRRLVDELVESSAEFAELWSGEEVSSWSAGSKSMLHPKAGPLTLESTCFSLDDQPGLSMLVMTPASSEDRRRIRTLFEG